MGEWLARRIVVVRVLNKRGGRTGSQFVKTSLIVPKIMRTAPAASKTIASEEADSFQINWIYPIANDFMHSMKTGSS
jgi:hypothetical protein